MGSSPCPPRFVCLFGGGNGKGKQEPDDAAQGAARKALEKALGGKGSAFSKWEETLKREADVGGRGSGRGGRGWFGGGGWEGFFDSGDDEDFWEETLHMTCALLAVCFLYMMIIAPREVTYFMAYITVNSVVNLLNGVIYYVWWLRMKAKGYKLVKRPARRPLRSPVPDQRYHHTNADDDDMGDWD